MDGGSSDATIDEARAAGGDAIEIISGPDAGLYDALARALPQSDGDVTLYLGAGDVLESTAFQVVSTIFSQYPDVQWLTGRATTRNSRREIVNSVLPHPFHRRFFACGMYGTRLPVLQQESTFWRTGLQRAVDFTKLSRTRLAGDYLLWKSFAELADLYVVNAVLGSFTQESGQLSVSGEAGAYLAELRQLRRPPTPGERLSALLLRLGTKHRIPRRSANRLFSFDFRREEWRLRGRARETD
jgi:glycosyltransferase involved in cell wall biosynthesis